MVVRNTGCLLVPAKVGSFCENFLVDSGSGVTVVSEEFFERTRMETKGDIKPSKLNLFTASGDSLEILGEISLCLEIGGRKFEHDVVIGNIGGTSGILGADFMQKHGCLLDLSLGTLKLGGHLIQLTRETSDTCSKVKVCKLVSVPPRSEMFVPGIVADSGFKAKSDCLLEGVDNFKRETGLLVPRCMVRLENEAVLVPLTNFSDKEIVVKAGTVVASVETSFSVNSLTAEKSGNVSAVDSDILPSHLEDLVSSVSPEVSECTTVKLQATLAEYQDVFHAPGGKLGRTSKVKHTIDTGDNKPVKLPPRRLPVAQREIVENELDKMLKDDLIEPSDSPWAANVVLVRKKDGSWRFCTDFRKLNELTRQDAFPLPHIQVALDALSGSGWFSTLD